MFIEAVWFQHAKVDPTTPTQHNKQIPTYIEKAILKAMAKERVERFEGIVSFIEALQTPETAEEWVKQGNVLRHLKRYEEALTAYEQAIQLNPNYKIAHYGKRMILELLGKKPRRPW